MKPITLYFPDSFTQYHFLLLDGITRGGVEASTQNCSVTGEFSNAEILIAEQIYDAGPCNKPNHEPTLNSKRLFNFTDDNSTTFPTTEELSAFESYKLYIEFLQQWMELGSADRAALLPHLEKLRLGWENATINDFFEKAGPITTT